MVQKPRKRYEYEKARFLRKRKGLSYNEIKKELNLSKSTISFWCKDILLSEKQQERLKHNQMNNQKMGALANKIKREKEIKIIKDSARKEIQEMGLNAFKIAGAVLYWAEGTKTQNTGISNADPRTIEFMMRWLNKIFNKKPSQIKAYLHIHYGDDDKRIKKYWSKLTGIPLINFGKSFIKPKGTGHRTNILPNGIIKIRIAGKGTENLRHRILTWSEKIYELSKKYK